MNILIAPNAFKHAATASEVSHYLRDGIKAILPASNLQVIPLADGGQGTVESLVEATHGRIIRSKVLDPLGREIDSFFGITGDGETAVIEMAAASGIERLRNEELNPLETDTFGTGQLIKAALDAGCRKIIIGIGGSATNDGGVGMAAALGVKFLDSEGLQVPYGGGHLKDIHTIDTSEIDQRIHQTTIQVACDVTNPLTGREGAAYVYGPQKGADQDMVRELDKNLSFLAARIREYLDVDIEKVSGSGAAGGLGAGLMAFCGARLRNGFEIISDLTDLGIRIQNADLVITGEGKIDEQTAFGKTVGGVARLASKYSKPVIAVAGTITDDAETLYESGINYMFSILRRPVCLEEALDTSPNLIRQAGKDIARIVKLCRF